jgi:hypothetical protein
MVKYNVNYDLVIAFLILFLLGIGIGFYGGYEYKKCPELLGQVVIVHDSITPAKDTMVIKVISGKPKKVKTAKFTDTLKVDTNLFSVNTCLDTNYYEKLTYYPDSFRARASAQVTQNELISWNFEFQNLKPEHIKVIERTNTIEKKQSLVKVYAGLYGGVALKGKSVANYKGGVAFDAIISDKHLIGLNGGLNSFLQPEVGIRFSEKIRLGK